MRFFRATHCGSMDGCLGKHRRRQPWFEEGGVKCYGGPKANCRNTLLIFFDGIVLDFVGVLVGVTTVGFTPWWLLLLLTSFTSFLHKKHSGFSFRNESSVRKSTRLLLIKGNIELVVVGAQGFVN